VGGDMGKPSHRTGSYFRRAMKLRAAANANPNTTCWRCGRTLAEHPPHKTGKPAIWTAGHVRDGDPTSPLMPEASTCNYTAGTILRNQRHTTPPPSRRW